MFHAITVNHNYLVAQITGFTASYLKRQLNKSFKYAEYHITENEEKGERTSA